MISVPVPKVAPRSFDEIETVVALAINQFSPIHLREPRPFPIIDFCERYLPDRCAVQFGVSDLRTGIAGEFLGDTVEISEEVYLRALAGDGRSRFTLAHEAAHALLHKSQLQSINRLQGRAVRLFRRNQLRPAVDPEWQANTGAAALLMPRTAVRALLVQLGSDTDPLGPMCRAFHVSRSAALTRLKVLGGKGLA